jgi:adenosylcobinamide-GDP ribazoletransferase
MIHAFFYAWQFLTRFPSPRFQHFSQRAVAASLLYYPLIGALMGAVLWQLNVYLPLLPLNPWLQAAVLLLLWVWMSGGLHLDGVADCADAEAGGNGDRQRILELMKDSAAGTAAVINLVLVLLLKWAALLSLIRMEMTYLLVIILALGRSSVLFLFTTTAYVRKDGLGQSMAQGLQRGASFTVFLLVVIGSVAAMPYQMMLLPVVFALYLLWIRRKWMKLIGGITGDVCGMAIEKSETLMLLTAALLLSLQAS